jgi:RNA polymerase sigma-70 factor (ECF subfamily)
MAEKFSIWPEEFRRELLDFAKSLADKSRYRVEAEDLVQVTIADAARKSAPSSHAAAKLAWLKEALRNNFLDAVKRLTAGKRDVRREQPYSQEPPAKVESPSRRLRVAEEVQKLIGFLDRLPDDQKQAVRMRYIEELPLEEVARQMGKSYSAVRGLLQRGLAALRAAFTATRRQ